MPVADLSSSAARARAPQPPKPDEAPEVIEAVTGFLVYVKKIEAHPGYEIVCSPNINVPIVVDRQPTHDEVVMYCEVVKKDIVGQQYAQMATAANLQMQSFLGQQLAAQQQVEQLGDLKL